MERRKRADINADSRKKNKLREPLDIGKNILVLAERLRKKDAPGFLHKSTTQNKLFLNKDQIFILYEKEFLMIAIFITGFLGKESKKLTIEDTQDKNFLH